MPTLALWQNGIHLLDDRIFINLEATGGEAEHHAGDQRQCTECAYGDP
ncbi:hypothetical protein YPPY61_2647 [Yersinia pestis PY-61]|nr:hypothetical protein YPPY61_2647 [Yersinia pestis PY-61]